MNKSWSLLFSLGCCAVSNFWFSNSVSAQISADGTTNTTVNNDGIGNFTIEQGDRAGNNLFHSFGDFSVPNNGSAFFDNATDISNIFSRVTGGNLSSIDGLIRANGSANLFLVNPAGILFGNNARLDIGGSFLGTTADSILFEDGVFSATDLDNPPLLIINAPIGLSFRDNPSEIVNSSFAQNDAGEFIGLEVEPGNNLSLIGGDISFEAGEVTARGGRVELGGLSDAGTITIEPNGSLTFPQGVARSNVSFTNAADVDVVAEGGGTISVTANNIELLGGEFGGSSLRAGISSSSTSPDAQAGDINLNATGDINISQGSNIFNQVATSAIGNSGNIIINTTDLTLSDGSQITAGVFGTGNAGNVTINASGDTTFQGIDNDGFPSGIINNVAIDGVGDAGNIQVNTANLNLIDGGSITSNVSGQGSAGTIEIIANSLNLNDGGVISSSIFGQGNAGSIAVDASSSVNISGFSQISSSTFAEVVGNAGSIEISTNSLSLSDGSFLNSSINGQGNVGNINLDISNTTELTTSNIFSQVGTMGDGDAGNITLNTTNLSLLDGAQITAAVFGEGNAGSVTIGASNTITFQGLDPISGNSSGILNNVEPGGSGNAGNIQVNTANLNLIDGGSITSNVSGQGSAGTIEIIANSLNLNDGGVISSSIFGQGNAGNINLDISNTTELTTSNIFSQVGATGDGLGGNITLNTTDLSLLDGAQISAGVFGTGDAGNVIINASGDTSFQGVNPNSGLPSGILNNVAPGGIGNAGNIQVNTANLNLIDGGVISSSIFGEGNAGNITINASDAVNISGFTVFDENITRVSQVSSSTGTDVVGNAGSIEISAESLSLSDGGLLNVNTFGQGNAGTITINATSIISVDGESLDGSVSGIFSTVADTAVGNSGAVNITTNDLTLTEGGAITASTFGQGNAGTITITSSGNIFIDGESLGGSSVSGIFSAVADTGQGNASGINITTTDLSLSNNGIISVSSLGEGNAGNLSINSNSLTLDTNAALVASTPIGTGGNINLQIAENLTLDENSTITAEAFGNANGGNLTIDANFIIAFPNETPGNGSDITANAAQGQGGLITINAQSVLGIEERPLNDSTNDINASSDDSDLDGEVIINTPDTNSIQGTTEIPNNIIAPDQSVAQACSNSPNTSVASSFVINGKGGVPPLPESPLSSEIITVNGKVANNSQSSYAIPTSYGDIIPARGVIKTADGKIILTPTPVSGSASRGAAGSRNCG